MSASWVVGTGKQTARPLVMATRGIASAGHPLAAQTAVRVLMDGGNAVDAAVAASAVLAVARPHATGLGGDLFCLIHLAGERKVVAINASGPAPRAANIAHFRERGAHHIPLRGALSVETPGCVAGWDLALHRYGTMTLGDVLRYAVEYADRGVPVSPGLSRAIHDGAQEFAKSAGWIATFAPNGHTPRPGELLKQPDLVRTLRAIQEGGSDAFYHGPIAEEIDAFMRENGGLLSKDDLADCLAEELEPLRLDYRGYTVFEQPPVSQGHLLLQQLAIAEGFDLRALGQDSAETVHLMVECKKLAFADRLRYAGDPTRVRVPLSRLISREYASERRRSIDPSRAIIAAAPGAMAASGPDTTHHCVMDAEGNAVTMIQSLFRSFGSGMVAGNTGVVLNNRLAAFFLDPEHPNALEPGKRTIHTLNTFMLFKDGNPLLAGGTPGADDQVQVNFQIVSDLVDHEMGLQEAIEAPRWSSTPGTMAADIASPYELRMERGFPTAAIEGLKQRGHAVREVNARSFGSLGAVLRDPESGVLCGGSDPRRDGYAVGW